MSKELEAFKEVREYLNYVLYENGGSRAMACTSTSQYLEPYIATIEQALKVFEIIKGADFGLDFDESQNEWFLYIFNEEQQSMLVTKGTGIKTYELLKEKLLYERN